MILGFYYVMFGVSLLMLVIYAFIFHKHFDTNLTIIAALVPIINMGFVLMASAKHVEEALIALRLTYLGGCYLLVAAMFLIFNVCQINLKPWMRVVILAISTGVYVTTLTIGHSDIFYVGMPTLEFNPDGSAFIANKHYGFMHTVFYVMVVVFYLLTAGAIVYSFLKKKQVPRSILLLIVLAVTIAVFGFFGSRLITHEVEILPATYNLGMIIYIIIASRLRLYDASDSVLDSLVQKGDTGFVSFDNKMRYLNSNLTAREMIPELNELVVDHRPIDGWLDNRFSTWMEEYHKDNSKDKQYIEKNDKVYLITVSKLMIGKMHRGYQFLVSDDTANQQYIKLIKNYNSQLEEEVVKKTRHIIDMQDKLVLGMATMVEGRDNSTGGHIKRTSDCIRIIVNQINEDGDIKLSESFSNNLIKAAPMHDLGKITIDDRILRKPGKFTPEEYEEMKKHPAEGARIVSRILEGIDDEELKTIAVNVAHYHHEKYNGLGYPKGLKGEEIPLEARIMALADVYDALISKRVYKEKFTFEQANEIILNEMGKQFDPKLEKVYLSCRDKLEEYYSSIDC
ncbi:MAG: HD domain-containing protein [Erysipelotrichaceae bacterium]|nr:HD domain-containing protein [Erysipelotrichaceae bacterium]